VARAMMSMLIAVSDDGVTRGFVCEDAYGFVAWDHRHQWLRGPISIRVDGMRWVNAQYPTGRFSFFVDRFPTFEAASNAVLDQFMRDERRWKVSVTWRGAA